MIEQWIEVKPLDTLFFKGGEPMEAGETHEAGVPVFPPVPETLVGALRTAILAQKGIRPSTVRKLSDDESLNEKMIPFWGTPTKSDFWVAGPLFKVGGVTLFPAPANWFVSKEEGREPKVELEIEVFEASPVALSVIVTSKDKLFWVENPPADMKTVTGEYWLNCRALANQGKFKLKVARELKDISNSEPLAVPSYLLVKTEERVGIARENVKRVAKKGHLYAARHIRLQEGVTLLIGFDKPLCRTSLHEKGSFQLGGEGRMVSYRLIDKNEAPQLPGKGNGRFLAISPLKYSKAQESGLLEVPYASLKLWRVAGWDMRKGFHKPAEAYFPAGAVFWGDKSQLTNLTELILF